MVTIVDGPLAKTKPKAVSLSEQLQEAVAKNPQGDWLTIENMIFCKGEFTCEVSSNGTAQTGYLLQYLQLVQPKNITELLQQIEKLTKLNTNLYRQIKSLTNTGNTLVDLLGPNGKKLVDLLEDRGVESIKPLWTEKAFAPDKTGEDRAQIILDMYAKIDATEADQMPSQD